MSHLYPLTEEAQWETLYNDFVRYNLMVVPSAQSQQSGRSTTQSQSAGGAATLTSGSNLSNQRDAKDKANPKTELARIRPIVAFVLQYASLIEVQRRFRQLNWALGIVFPIAVLAVGAFAWAVNPTKDVGKELDKPFLQQGLILNENDKALLVKTGLEPNCLVKNPRVLILRERAARIAEGVVMTQDCRPVRVTVSRDGHILEAK
jgi:hypothetical protein